MVLSLSGMRLHVCYFLIESPPQAIRAFGAQRAQESRLGTVPHSIVA